MNPETGLPSFPDNHFDLAIVDPPYMDCFNTDNWVETSAPQKDYKDKQLTLSGKKPSEEYFKHLFRASRNQIIWGGNYFILPISRGWIVWYKSKSDNYFSDAEMAWSSFDRVTKVFDFLWSGMLQGNMKNKEQRLHPTQKPIALYRWLLKNYAKQGDLILDTHVGSASSLIAFEEMGFDYVGFELDADYYRDSCKRIEAFRAQPKLFTGKEVFEASKPPTLF